MIILFWAFKVLFSRYSQEYGINKKARSLLFEGGGYEKTK